MLTFTSLLTLRPWLPRAACSAAAAALLLGLTTACATTAPTAPAADAATGAAAGRATLATSFGKESEVRHLAKLMEGSYNSAEQANNDKEYFDIRLHIARIWRELPESQGIYLYVEQATASAQQRPYRQRVYHLRVRQEDGKIESVVYELPSPIRFTGQWKEAKPLANITSDSLITRQGCAVVMRRSSRKEYRGATVGQECLSSLRGAKYAQTDVTITPKQLISWDRGFDDKGEQVWGAKFGGYIFKKETAATRPPAASQTKGDK